MVDRVVSLMEFREQLQALMDRPKLRPFLCDGSPLKCRVFIVGSRPATEMSKDFWTYWNDESGFHKQLFMKDYLKKRGLARPIGDRARIERMVNRLPKGSCLETNIFSKPAPFGEQLKSSERKTVIFEFLMKSIRPFLVLLNGKDAFHYSDETFRTERISIQSPQEVEWDGLSFKVMGTISPLFRMAFTEAEEIADLIKRVI